MEVILLEHVRRLGAMGEIVKVKNGFARNFLLPFKKAMRANESNKKVFEAKRAEIEAKNNEQRGAAQTHAKKMEGSAVSIVRQASEDGKLYGSVTVRDIADALKAQGHDVPRSQIVLSTTIKTTGAYTAKVALHPEVIVDVTVNVMRNEADHAPADEDETSAA